MRRFLTRTVWTVFITLSLSLSHWLAAQNNNVAIGSPTTKDKAILWLNNSGGQGLLLPSLTTSERTGMGLNSTDERGMVVYDNQLNQVFYWSGAGWVAVTGGTGTTGIGLRLQGNVIQLVTDGSGSPSVGLAIQGTPIGLGDAGRILVWDGTQWTTAPKPTTTGQILKWDNTTGAWTLGTDNTGTTPALPTNNIFVGNGSGLATAVPMTGDASIVSSGAVTITNNAVTNPKIADNAVSTTKIADDAVTSAKIAPGTITATDLAGNISIGTTGTITSSSLTVSGSGTTTFNGRTYTWPNPSPAGILTHDGAGGLTWAPTGSGVTGVTASAPLQSSGGANPNITFPSWPANAAGVLTNNGTGTLSWAAAGGTGTVTSVGLTMPSIFNIAGSPVTTSGTINATLASQAANTFFGAPNGSAGVPTFRSLVANDIPSLDASKITAGTLPTGRGGTGLAGPFTNGQLLIGNGTGLTTATLTAGTGISITNGAGAITINSTASGDITDVVAGIGLSGGGTTGSVTLNLTNTAVTAGAYGNATNIPQLNIDAQGRITGATNVPFSPGMTNPMTNPGDLILGGAAGAPTRLGIGGNGQVLTSNGTTATWQNLAGGGTITGVTPGLGLTGGGVSGNVTLNIVAGTSNGEVLKWNGSNWAPGTDNVGGGGVPTLTPGQILVGNGTTNSGVGVSGDLTLAFPANFQIAADAVTTAEIAANTITNSDIDPAAAISVNKLAAGGANQILQTIAGVPTWSTLATGATDLNGLSDVITSAPAGGHVLVYNNGSSNFENRALSGDIGSVSATGLVTIANDAITSAKIATGTIVNSDISASAAIDGAKINPNFVAQNVVTTGAVSAGAVNVNGQTYTWPAAQAAGVLTNNGSGTLTWSPAGGTGTVTSVGLSLPSLFSVTGSPVTTTGTLTATLASQAANSVFAAPSGAAGAPTFRTLVAADIPNLDASKITTGTLAITRGGTGATTVADARTNLGLGALATLNSVSSAEITDGTIAGTDLLSGININTTGTITAGATTVSALTVPGTTTINTRTYSWPNTAAAANTFLRNDGSGGLTWVTVAGSTDQTAQTGILQGNGTAITGLTASAGLQYLRRNAGNTAFEFGAIDLGTTGVTGALPTARGGTGLTAAPTNGQLPIGNGTGYTLAPLTAGSGINIVNAAGSITISATGGPSNLDALTDAAVATPVAGQVLVYNGTTDFQNRTLSGDISTISATGAVTLANSAATRTNLGLGALATLGAVSGGVLGTITDGTISGGDLAPNIGISTTGNITAANLSGNGSGITALSASNISTGTLPVARGGTGLSSFGGGLLYASGPTTIGDIGNGTVGQVLMMNATTPTWTTLPTAATPANTVIRGNAGGTAQEASSIFDNGTYTGIGRTAPIGASRFDIQASGFGAAAYGGMYIQTDNTGLPFYGYSNNGGGSMWTYWNGGTGTWNVFNGGDRLSVTNAGNIGIGTTTPSGRTHITGTGNIGLVNESSNTIGTWQSISNTSTGGQIFSIISTGSANAQGAGKLLITANSGIGTTVRDILAMNHATGHVGIGTSTPNAPLHISASGTEKKIVLFETANNEHQYLGFGYTGLGELKYQVGFPANDHVFLAGNGTAASNELLRIKGTGQVGIGISAPNNGVLHLGGDAGYNGIHFTHAGSGNTSADGFLVGPQTTNSNQLIVWNFESSDILFGTTATERARFNSAGNFGIGSTNPVARLDVSSGGGSTAPQARIFQSNGADFGRLRFASAASGTSHWDIGALTTGTAGTELFTFWNQAAGINVMSLRGTGQVTLANTDWDVNGLLLQSTSTSAGSSIRFTNPAVGNRTYDIIGSTGSGAATGIGAFGIWDDTNGAYRFVIGPSGDVGIGINNPSKKLHAVSSPTADFDAAIYGSSSAGEGIGFYGAMAFRRGTTNYGVYAHSDAIANTSPLGVNRGADGALVNFMSGGVVQGQITVSGTTVAYGAFTGVHYAISDESNLQRGLLVTLTGSNNYYHGTREAEILHGIKISTVANDAKIMGSFFDLIDPHQPHSLDNPYQIMSVGNGEMWIVDNGSNLEPGDYLISSGVAGHGMKDSGEFEVANIIARVAEPVNWGTVADTINGVKRKKVAVFYESFVINHKADRLEREIDGLKTELAEIRKVLGLEAKKN